MKALIAAIGMALAVAAPAIAGGSFVVIDQSGIHEIEDSGQHEGRCSVVINTEPKDEPTFSLRRMAGSVIDAGGWSYEKRRVTVDAKDCDNLELRILPPRYDVK